MEKRTIAKYEVGTIEYKIKLQELKEKKGDIIDTKDHLTIDKIYVLKGLLVGQMVDTSKGYSSDAAFKPIFENDDQIEEIRDKIMSLIKKL